MVINTKKSLKKIWQFTKKSGILAVLIISVFFSGVLSAFAASSSASVSYPVSGYTIVLDSGHGGRDGGAIGVAGTIESELNLEYTYAIRDMLVSAGFTVILTRQNSDALYSPTATNKKMDDLKKRIEIINAAQPDVVLSIHMNSIGDSVSDGAFVYYCDNNVNSERLASTLASTYYSYLANARESPKNDPMYIIEQQSYPSALIECGFLSNPVEEQLLLTDEYCEKFAYTTLCGLLLYFGIYMY